MSVSRSRVPPGVPGSLSSLILDLVVARLTKLASGMSGPYPHLRISLFGFESITAWSCVCSSGRIFMVSSIHGSHESFYFVMSLDFLCCFILWPLSYQCSCFSEQVSPTPATDIHWDQTFINFHEQVLHLLEFNLDAQLSSSWQSETCE